MVGLPRRLGDHSYKRISRYSGLRLPGGLPSQQKESGSSSDNKTLPRYCCLERRQRLHFVHALCFHCSRGMHSQRTCLARRFKPARLGSFRDARVLGVSSVPPVRGRSARVCTPARPLKLRSAVRVPPRPGTCMFPIAACPKEWHSVCRIDCWSCMLTGTPVDARCDSRSAGSADAAQNRRSIAGIPPLSPYPPLGLDRPPSRYFRRSH